MKPNTKNLKSLIPAIFCFVTLIAVFGDKNHAFAQTTELDTLFLELQDPENEEWKKSEQKIWAEWGKSGSPAMDHLLRRGQKAMREGELKVAVGHFSTVIDHSPKFAEAWNMRATAFYLMGELGLSVADIQQTLRLNPRHFGAMAGLGTIFDRLDRKKEALAVYKRALEVHPHQDRLKENIERLEDEVKGTSL